MEEIQYIYYESGYNVLGIDKENTEELIRNKLTIDENKNFAFIQSRFEEIATLPSSDLVISMFSLPFCEPSKFSNVWETISNSINPSGYFVGNFFGKNDEWYGNKNMTFCDLLEVKSMLEQFEVININEKEYDKKTALGKLKHWDVIEVFARLV